MGGLRNWACMQPAFRGAGGGGGGFDPDLQWSPDFGFDNTGVWDFQFHCDVNATVPGELHVNGIGPQLQSTGGLPSIPGNGTYRITFPVPENYSGNALTSVRINFGKSFASFQATISGATFMAGGTFDFALTGATTRNFGVLFNVSGGGGAVFDMPFLGVKQIA
jgi:hypothetical protein